MTGNNLLFLMTDEHQRNAAGCYGHDFVQTPNIDRIAASGTRFTTAYTPSPICVPARASLATGRYVHDCRYWSNAQAYDGRIPSWGHRLIEAGHRCTSIGKLHYRGNPNDFNGFDEELMPLHIKDEQGWLRGLLRRPLWDWEVTSEFARDIGPGECTYTHYDREVAKTACEWIKDAASRDDDKPWMLFVSFVSPHYPLVVPQEFYDLYPLDRLQQPLYMDEDDTNPHPVLNALRHFFNYGDWFDDHTRKVAIASYYGLCTFVDDLIGQVVTTLEDSGQSDDTTLIYTSDHGEMLGNHNVWTKCVMYEDSAAIPMIISGDGIPAGAACDTPVSLVDCYPTIVEHFSVDAKDADDAGVAGVSLARIAKGATPERTVLSEYHDGGAITGMFMVRHGSWKYIYYPGYSAQLFNLESDPTERNNLAQDPNHGGVVEECHQKLVAVVDADAANELCFSDQAARIEECGGREAILASDDYDFTPVPT